MPFIELHDYKDFDYKKNLTTIITLIFLNNKNSMKSDLYFDTQSTVKALEMLSDLLPASYMKHYKKKYINVEKKWLFPTTWNYLLMKNSALEYLERNSNVYRMQFVQGADYVGKKAKKKQKANQEKKGKFFEVLIKVNKTAGLHRFFSKRSEPIQTIKKGKKQNSTITSFFNAK